MFIKFNITGDKLKLQLYAKNPQNVFGMPGTGKKIYPWSKLHRCKCGNKHPWMDGFPITPPDNEIVKEGELYWVVCRHCFRHTKRGTYNEAVMEWNTKYGISDKPREPKEEREP